MNACIQTSVNTRDCTIQPAVPPWKRALDISCIVLALPVLVPIVFLLGILIKMVSRGPVLFKQERIGLLGKPFICFKFRTMVVNARTDIHRDHLTRLMTSNTPMAKLDSAGDPRLIPFGSLLRAMGLDELPQLLNVLRGEMSLVGPRPCIPYEYQSYQPWHRRRFNTLPGLTGLWQVSGKNRTTFAEMMDLDIHYAARKTLWMDLGIIFRTIPAIIVQVMESRERKRTGAAAVSTASPSFTATLRKRESVKQLEAS